jgi:hypothetical protein
MARRGLVASVALPAALLVACEKPVPKNPSFDVDVKPLFEAHCVRCHGAGGTLNKDPLSVLATEVPGNGYLASYQDVRDCTPDAMLNTPKDCARGARSEAEMGSIDFYLHFPGVLRMPPAPSEPLTDWEMELVETWLKNGYPETVP